MLRHVIVTIGMVTTTYTASGSYTFTTTNASGCDSTATLNLTINSATLNLTINNSTSSTTDVTACDSYDWNGTTYTASGSYTFTTTNASGCDSTATLNLTINNTPNINIVASSTSLCFGDTSIISATIGLDSYEWYSINQSAIISNNNLINVTSNDSYFVVVTNDGCVQQFLILLLFQLLQYQILPMLLLVM